VRYADFRDRFEDALHEGGLFVRGVDRRIETIDLADGARHWEVNIWRANSRSAEPFHVSAVIAFTWDPINAARAYTTEEDLLEAVIGRRRRDQNRTPLGPRGSLSSRPSSVWVDHADARAPDVRRLDGRR
jgi:hypothetical protein